ncbi:MAG: bifunctional riboflavin kinase/FAD synthetase [Clostridia bacterium]
MKKHFFYNKYENPIVLALGFFDCVHIGHNSLIDEVLRLSKKYDAESAVMTFNNNPNELLKKEPQIYTLTERSIALQNLGVENLIFTYFNEEFLNLSPVEFLDILTQNFNITSLVVGKDYTFGANAEGNIDTLLAYMAEKNIKVKVLQFEKIFDTKVSTTSIKKLVKEGNIVAINKCLTEPYFMVGTIIHGSNRGNVIGYPTANLSCHEDCLQLASGVYATKIIIDGSIYDSLTNVGKKPTFDDESYSIETNIFDYNRDIYGKEVVLKFYMRIRDVVKFNSVPVMIKQLESDKNTAQLFFAEQEK